MRPNPLRRTVLAASFVFLLAAAIPGISDGYHNLSHHGMDPGKIGQLTLVESARLQEFAASLGRLRAIGEDGSNLLERTTILDGSRLGNARNRNQNNNNNMPVLPAGCGGFEPGPAPGRRPRPQLPAAQPVRHDAAAPRAGGRSLRLV